MAKKDFHPIYDDPKIIPTVNVKNRTGILYHLTPVKNIPSILKNGLRETDGLIWFFDSMDRSTILTVALIKNFDFGEFGILKIDKKGCTGHLTTEKFKGSRHRHVYLKQDIIAPEFIKVEGVYSVNVKKIH